MRDRAIFVGEPDDIVPDPFGPDLPPIRDWTETHFDFAGYVTDSTPRSRRPRAPAGELGYRPDEQVCIVTVGGSGVGGALLRRVDRGLSRRRRPRARAADDRRRRAADRPAVLPSHPGLEVRAYVRRPYRHLAACDLAVVQGGLTTTIELTADRRPFLAFPSHHFEQNFHVRHRLDRHGAGRLSSSTTRGAHGDRRGDRGGDRARRGLPPGRGRRRRARGRRVIAELLAGAHTRRTRQQEDAAEMDQGLPARFLTAAWRSVLGAPSRVRSPTRPSLSVGTQGPVEVAGAPLEPSFPAPTARVFQPRRLCRDSSQR